MLEREDLPIIKDKNEILDTIRSSIERVRKGIMEPAYVFLICRTRNKRNLVTIPTEGLYGYLWGSRMLYVGQVEKHYLRTIAVGLMQSEYGLENTTDPYRIVEYGDPDNPLREEAFYKSNTPGLDFVLRRLFAVDRSNMVTSSTWQAVDTASSFRFPLLPHN